MSIEQVNVPDIGGAEGAEVIELLVQAGDEVKVDDGLVVLESDKASMEIPSTVAGKVVELLVSEGDELVEGSPVAKIEVDGESADAGDAEGSDEKEAEDKESAKDVSDKAPKDGGEETAEKGGKSRGGRSEKAEEDDRKTRQDKKEETREDSDESGQEPHDKKEEPEATEDTDENGREETAAGDKVEEAGEEREEPGEGEADASSKDVPREPPSERGQRPGKAEETTTAGADVHAGPAVRKMARELGVPLAQVSGSGPAGRVLKEDLQEFVRRRFEGAAGPAGAMPELPEQDFAKFGDIEVTERSRLDKLTAANMHRSWLNVPHVTQFDAADITELESFRRDLKAEAEERGTKLSPLPFVLKACAVALQDNPRLNSSLAAGGEQLVSKNYCHIGMAVDTSVGLMVPVIRDVDRKSVWELAEEVVTLAAKARDRKLKPAEMQGGTFSVSSLGRVGGMGFTPVINTPEVGILGVSRAEVRPVWDGNQFAPRTLLPLALSYDHRVVNGGDGGRFLTRVVTLLGDIRRLLM